MVTYRTDDPARWGVGKGANLTASEIDGNFWELAQRLVAVETNPAAPNNISAITVVGSQMTVHMEDGSTHGPFTLPTAMIHYRGDWAAGVSYDELDIVAAPDDAGIYLSTRTHVSAATFDPLAVDADGNRLYQWLFPTQATGLSGLSDVQDAMAPVAGQALVYDGTAWAPGNTTSTLAELGDTYIPVAPAEGQFLSWEGATWRAVNLPASVSTFLGLTDTPAAFGVAGQLAAVNGTGDGLVFVDPPSGTSAGALNDLSDVTITTAAAAQFLRFDGTAWVNAVAAWADIGSKPATVAALPGALGTVGQVLKVDAAGTGIVWAADESGTGGGALNDLSDVTLTTPAAGQVLKFDGAAWVNAADEAGSGGATNLDGLSDVVVTAPAVAQVLRFNGTEWVNVPLDWADLSGKPATFPPSAHTHPWGDVSGKPATVDALPPALGAEKQVLKVSGGALVWADLLGGGAYTHWRVRLLAGNVANPVAMQEMQFRSEAGVPETPSGGAVIHLGWTTPERAFDGVVSMSSNAQSSNTAGNWLGYQFPQPRMVRELWIRQFAAGYDLTHFVVEASNDGAAWDEVLRVEGATYPGGAFVAALPALADPVNADTLKNVAPSAFALTLLDDADAAAARATLGAPDIEKGVFTPVVIGDVTPGAATYTYQWGDYTRVGDIVHVSLRVNWSGHTGSGSMRISGLPFVSRGHRNALSLWPDSLNMGNANQYPSALMWRSDSYIQLYGVPLGGPDAEATMMPLPASGNVIISGSYHV